jgi:hypothetical protein
MKALQKLLVLSAAWVAGGSASAHHSFAMFDLDREVTLEGAVKEFQWTNPHVWLQILVPDGKGATTEWSLEMGAPGMLTRTGWKSSLLKPNDKVTVILNPLKTGAPSGRLVRVTLPNGRVMGPGGPALPPPPKPAA